MWLVNQGIHMIGMTAQSAEPKVFAGGTSPLTERAVPRARQIEEAPGAAHA